MNRRHREPVAWFLSFNYLIKVILPVDFILDSESKQPVRGVDGSFFFISLLFVVSGKVQLHPIPTPVTGQPIYRVFG